VQQHIRQHIRHQAVGSRNIARCVGERIDQWACKAMLPALCCLLLLLLLLCWVGMLPAFITECRFMPVEWRHATHWLVAGERAGGRVELFVNICFLSYLFRSVS
jgi:hypothetical protein